MIPIDAYAFDMNQPSVIAAVVAVIAATVLYMALRKAMRRTNMLPKL